MRKERKAKVSVVIVNYNTRDVLNECLRNLEGINWPLQIVVVDNNSSDGSVQVVYKQFPKVEILPQSVNFGLAAGNNIGLDKANGEYILFMGSDAFPDKDAIPVLIDFMQTNDKVGVCVGQVRLRDGSLDRDTHRGFPTPWVGLTHFSGLEQLFPKSRLLGGYYMEYEDLNQVHEVDLCTSHFMLTRRAMFEDIGKWDENFFVYGEDVDLCWRAKRAGWKIMYVPQAHVTHYKGVSVGIRQETQDITKATAETKQKMSKERTEAMMKFYRKHYGEGGGNKLIFTGIMLLAKLRSLKTY